MNWDNLPADVLLHGIADLMLGRDAKGGNQRANAVHPCRGCTRPTRYDLCYRCHNNYKVLRAKQQRSK